MNSRGHISIALVFITLATLLCLSLLTYTLAHGRISRARSKKIAETDKLYWDLVYYLHHYREKLYGPALQGFDQEGTGYFNSENFGDQALGTTRISNAFSCSETEKPYYKTTRLVNTLEVKSGKSPYKLEGEVVCDILKGNIPVTAVPLVLNRETGQTAEEFLEEQQIVSRDEKPVVVEKVETEMDGAGLLMDAFKIKGTSLTWRAIREKFGFPPSDSPIEPGIYILVEEDTVGCIFIQGDVQKLRFSIENSRQTIRVQHGGSTYELSYIPGQEDFSCWDHSVYPYSLFSEQLVINGNAWSIEQAGEAAFLENANILLFVSGKAVVTGSLETEKVDTKRIALTNLTLVGCDTGLPGFTGKEPGILVAPGEEDIHIQATMISDGTFENQCDNLELEGSIYAGDLESLGELELAHREGGFDSGLHFALKDFITIGTFFINYIEEVYDEDH